MDLLKDNLRELFRKILFAVFGRLRKQSIGAAQ
jgi:hypothetical protein